MNDLYRNDLRLYKNFFQTVMKLIEKRREGGKIYRKYDTPATPYERIMASEGMTKEVKEELTKVYESLNPAALKRNIDATLRKLYKAYERKTARNSSETTPRETDTSVSNHLIE